MYPLDGKWYGVALRGKAGEFLAMLDLDETCKNRTLPQYIVPSLHAKENKTLSPETAIETQVDKIVTYWGKRPCLLDIRYLRFSEDHGIDASWINQLLRTARQRLCQVIPVIGISADFYRASAVGAHARSASSGAAIRIALSDLFNRELRQLIETQLYNLGLPATECIIIVDLSDADLSDYVGFAKFVADWLFKIRAYGTWPRIVLQASSYPLKNPAKANNECRVRRSEWLAWQHLVGLDRSIKDFVLYGDFGADNGHIDFTPGIRRAIPHLRYADAVDWLIVRGDKNWQTIRQAAEKIVKSSSFSGELFSAGDEFIETRARGLAGIGNPTVWRQVNMNHHISLVTSNLSTLYGAPVVMSTKRRRAIQEEMFPGHSGQPSPAK